MQALRHFCILAVVAGAGKARFSSTYFSGKSGRGAFTLPVLPGRIKTIKQYKTWLKSSWPRLAPVWRLLSVFLLALFGIICQRDELTVSLPKGISGVFSTDSGLNLKSLKRLKNVPASGFFKYRYFLDEKDEEKKLIAYDGGRVPTITVQVQTQVQSRWRDENIAEGGIDNLQGDGEVLLYLNQIKPDGTEKQDVWKVSRPKEKDLRSHREALGKLMQAEIAETALFTTLGMILFAYLDLVAVKVVMLLLLFSFLFSQASLWQQIGHYYIYPTEEDRKCLDYVMLHLILCRHATHLVTRLPDPSMERSTSPHIVRVIMLKRQNEVSVDQVTPPGKTQDGGSSSTLGPSQNYTVAAAAEVEVRSHDDPDHGQHFRIATLPYINGLMSCIISLHGFAWFLTTTLVPTYKYTGYEIFLITSSSTVIKSLFTKAQILFVALILIAANTFTDYVDFRHHEEVIKQIRKCRNVFFILSGVVLYEWVFELIGI
ncbi:hypothetical protein BKA65DRAFT_501853 [Rhexocercosporidium sp. MPI-PUGE-AT-0058]|nr:hypothetical protein BKA65DRAFT_501853 [Rhexocercosporidium sp. MPI-PUGE-AT-0058]